MRDVVDFQRSPCSAQAVNQQVLAQLDRLQQIAELDNFVELGPSTAIEEQTFSEVDGTFTMWKGEPVAFVFPERLWHVVGPGSAAANLTNYLIDCERVRTSSNKGRYV